MKKKFGSRYPDAARVKVRETATNYDYRLKVRPALSEDSSRSTG